MTSKAGLAVEATLRLHLIDPAGTEHLLAEQTFELEPFEETQIGAQFLPTGAGEFRFRGTVESPTFPDLDPTNNTRTWAYQATLGVLWVVQ